LHLIASYTYPIICTVIGNEVFADLYRCALLRNVTISPTSAITQDEFANSFPTLHNKEITLDLIKGRFDEMPIHRLCSNYHPMERDTGDALIQMINPFPVKKFQDQDCLGMTPLHVQLCSGIDYDTPVIQYMIEKCPDAMLIKDIWDEVPLAYALLGNASIAIINFLFMSHSKSMESIPFDFGNMIHRLAKMGKPASFVRDVIQAQRTHSPGLLSLVDWQQIVIQSMSQGNPVPIGRFRVFVEASVSERCYNRMSNEHRTEVDIRICQIEQSNEARSVTRFLWYEYHYYDEIRVLVTRYVQLHNKLLQEVAIIIAQQATDAVEHVLDFL
jgi:hypothetical protein